MIFLQKDEAQVLKNRLPCYMTYNPDTFFCNAKSKKKKKYKKQKKQKQKIGVGWWDHVGAKPIK